MLDFLQKPRGCEKKRKGLEPTYNDKMGTSIPADLFKSSCVTELRSATYTASEDGVLFILVSDKVVVVARLVVKRIPNEK